MQLRNFNTETEKSEQTLFTQISLVSVIRIFLLCVLLNISKVQLKNGPCRMFILENVWIVCGDMT